MKNKSLLLIISICTLFIGRDSHASDATTPDSVSLTAIIKDSLNLGPAFQSWIAVDSQEYSNGSFQVTYIHPPRGNSKRVTEILKVFSTPNLDESSIDKFFEKKKKDIQKESIEEVKFHILKKSPKEIIYAFSYPMDESQYTEIVRTFVSGNKYHSASYLGPLPENIKQEENFQLWKEKLESMQIPRT